jgi:hypothetical protein
MKTPAVDLQSDSIDRPRSRPFRGPDVPRGASVLWPNLAFVGYLTFLLLTVSIVDWQELVIEPWLMLRGLKSYTDIATQHPPLLTALLAVLQRIFGANIDARILLLIVASTAVGCLSFLAADRLAGRRAAVFSLLLLAIFWPFYGGLNFWFDTFLPVFYLIAYVLIITGNSARSFFLAGVSLGLAFLLKQSSGLVGLVMGIMTLAKAGDASNRLRRFLVFSAGIGTPIILLAIWYLHSGQLADAFYWIIQYNLSGLYVRLAKAWPPRNEIIRLLIAIVPIVFVLIKAAFSKAFRKRIPGRYLSLLVLGFIAAFTIFPRWERWHVAPAVPFLAISLALSGTLLLTGPDPDSGRQTRRLVRPLLAAWLLVVFFDVGMFYPPLLINRVIPHFAQHWPFHSYARPQWVDEHYLRYRRDFASLAQSVRDLTREDDRITVWGWEGERLYRASDRLPAGRFYYGLPWFTSLPRFKMDLMSGFRQHSPRLVIELKKQYPGVPSLLKFGVDLEGMGYYKLKDLEEKFPEVVIWGLGRSSGLAGSDEKSRL